jgi:hypothetical protein
VSDNVNIKDKINILLDCESTITDIILVSQLKDLPDLHALVYKLRMAKDLLIQHHIEDMDANGKSASV